MAKGLNPNQAGLAFGGLLSTVHLVWSVLVAAGVAQACIDFILKLHMIEPAYKVMAFSLPLAAGLIIVTFLFGYIMGYLLAMMWNMMQKG